MVFSGAVFLLAALISAAILLVWRTVKPYETAFLPGLYLEEYALDGLTPEQAASLLYDRTETARKEWSAVLRWKGKEYRLSSDEIGLSVDREATLGPLWRVGREGNLLSRFWAILRARAGATRAKPVVRYDEAPVRAFLSRLKDEVDRPAVDATAAFDPKLDNPFSYTDEQTGYLLETGALFTRITEAAETLQSFETEAMPTVLEPRVYRRGLESATCLRARVRLALDTGAALQNERLSLSGLNGRMIGQGEVFSFNGAVGGRSEEAGYTVADEPGFGPYAEGIGGGVCRIATMLYQSALLAGLPVRERHAAVYPVPYAEPGQEAAVSDRGLDLRIENDTGYPLWIVAQEWEEKEQLFAEIQILGEPLGVRYKLESEKETGTAPAAPVYVRDREARYAKYTDDRVPVGRALPEVTARTRLTEEDLDGAILSERILTEDHYDAIPRRIYVGAAER